MTFIDVWIVYAIFGVTVFSLVFAWAVRNRQFSDWDRGRYIALDAGQPERPEHPELVEGSKGDLRWDRWGLRVMIVISGMLLSSAVVVAIRACIHGTCR